MEHKYKDYANDLKNFKPIEGSIYDYLVFATTPLDTTISVEKATYFPKEDTRDYVEFYYVTETGNSNHNFRILDFYCTEELPPFEILKYIFPKFSTYGYPSLALLDNYNLKVLQIKPSKNQENTWRDNSTYTVAVLNKTTNMVKEIEIIRYSDKVIEDMKNYYGV